MQIDKTVEYIDHREPLLVEWALDKYKALQDVSADGAARFGEAVFSEAFIRSVLNGDDFGLKARMFTLLPSGMFSALIDELAERWAGGDFELINDTKIVKIIAANSPSKARDLLMERLSQVSLEDKMALAPCWEFLAPDDAVGFSHGIIDDYLAADDELSEEDRFTFGLIMAMLAVKHAHPDAVSLVRRFVSDSLKKDNLDVFVFLYNLFGLFGADEFEFDLFNSLTEKEIEKLPAELNRLYTMENGADLFNGLAVDAMGEGIGDFKEFVLGYLDAVKDETVKEALKMLATDDGIAEALEQKNVRGGFQGAVLSLLWNHYRIDSLDASSLTEEEVVAFLLLEVESHPFMEQFQEWFSGIDGERAEALLLGLLEKTGDGLAAFNVLTLMAHLKNPAFVPFLIDHFKKGGGESSDALMEKSAGVLSCLGNPVVNCLDEAFESLDPACYLYLFNILERVGTPEAEAFLVKHLDTFMRVFKSDVLHTCAMLLSEAAVKLLEGKIGKDQFVIDRLFVVVSLLTGKRTEKVDELLKICNREHASFAKTLGSILDHDLENAGTPCLTLEMECENCGDINDYKAFTVYHSSRQAPYVADEFICLNCHEVCDFKLTQRGLAAVFGETARLVSLVEKGGDQEELLEKSPVKFIRVAIAGREMGVDEGIALYKAQIASSPDDPENYIGIGNVYKFCNQNIFAERSYLKAIELGPTYLEPYYSLAQLFVTKENDAIALEWLEKGRKYLKKPVLCKTRQSSVQKVLEGYIELYNSLVHKTQSDLNPIDIKAYRDGVLKSKKTGRNDPCPCGSGKKYKKCCMAK